MTTTRVKLAAAAPRPIAGSRVVVLRPDVQLSVITAGGVPEPRADWSKQGQDNLDVDIRAALDARHVSYVALDPGGIQDPRAMQLLLLDAAVGQSILMFNYGVIHLPTHKDGFDWTLGEGTNALGQMTGADYALFITARGGYSSSGRVAVLVGAALLGVALPTGGQYVEASLVDLKTGRIIWFNVAHASPGADMRNAEGARSLVESVLKSAPFAP